MDAVDSTLTGNESSQPVKQRKPRAPRVASDRVEGRQRVRQRGIFNGTQLRLAVAPIDGFVQHWFVDRPGRIQMAVQGGWEAVKKGETHFMDFDSSHNVDEGDGVTLVCGGADNGSASRMVLMKIRQEFFDEDQADRINNFNSVMEPIKRDGVRGVSEGKISNSYIPKTGKLKGETV